MSGDFHTRGGVLVGNENNGEVDFLLVCSICTKHMEGGRENTVADDPSLTFQLFFKVFIKDFVLSFGISKIFSLLIPPPPVSYPTTLGSSPFLLSFSKPTTILRNRSQCLWDLFSYFGHTNSFVYSTRVMRIV